MAGGAARRTVAAMTLLRPAPVLFATMFASQASFLVLTAILPDLAGDFGVSTATAGQARTLAAVAGAVTALALGRLGRRLGVRELLLLGLGLVAVGSLASALAPNLAAFAGAQAAIGAAAAILLSAGVAAAGEWAEAGERARVLSWALLGQPAAWVAGMPLIGVISDLDWRYAWLAVPLAASVVALPAVALRPGHAAPGTGAGKATPAGTGPVWRRPPVARWALGELMAYSGWGATLVYAGALFIHSYGLSTAQTGVLLGAAALGYFPGTLLARRHAEQHARSLLVALGLTAAAGTALFGLVRPSPTASLVLFVACMAAIGGRTIAGSSFGLDAAPDQRVAVMSLRAAAVQFGYLLGAASGGAALAAGGYGLLGATLGVLFLLGATPHLRSRARWGRPREGRDSHPGEQPMTRTCTPCPA
jgi:MFS transporter, DHA1 family, inner membrane transport protein